MATSRSPRRAAPADALLAWYDRHRRDLPWRAKPGERPDPYAVWLSEVMLQQTTVATVKAYYERFLRLWPRVEDLAAAPADDVMRAWAGLGYYSRARNLRACAKLVVERHGGRFPDAEADLRALPGIGAYTAAAVAAIAFDRRAVVVDGNVERVATRLFAIGEPMPAAKAAVRSAVDGLTPGRRAGDFAQAMMDLGATICAPRQPLCPLCPLASDCRARATGDMERFPVKAPRAERPRRAGAVFVLRRSDGAVLVQTRRPRGLLGGMTEFPGTEWTADFDLAGAADSAPLAADWRLLSGGVDHVFTHFALRLAVFFAEAPAGAVPPGDARWSLNLDAEALPTLMRKVARLVVDAGVPPALGDNRAVPRLF
jgi:A/G-specific adenine glycosylase